MIRSSIHIPIEPLTLTKTEKAIKQPSYTKTMIDSPQYITIQYHLYMVTDLKKDQSTDFEITYTRNLLPDESKIKINTCATMNRFDK